MCGNWYATACKAFTALRRAWSWREREPDLVYGVLGRVTPESGLYFMRLCSKSLGTGGWWAAPDPGAEMDDRWRGRGEPKGPAVRICKIHSGRRTRHSPEMGTGMRRSGSGPCWDTKSTCDRRAARPLSRTVAAAPGLLGPNSFPRGFLPLTLREDHLTTSGLDYIVRLRHNIWRLGETCDATSTITEHIMWFAPLTRKL